MRSCADTPINSVADFRKRYGWDAVMFRLLVQQYIDQTNGTEIKKMKAVEIKKMATAILDGLEDLRCALARDPAGERMMEP